MLSVGELKQEWRVNGRLLYGLRQGCLPYELFIRGFEWFYLHLVSTLFYPLLKTVGGYYGKKAQSKKRTYAEAYYEKTPQ